MYRKNVCNNKNEVLVIVQYADSLSIPPPLVTKQYVAYGFLLVSLSTFKF